MTLSPADLADGPAAFTGQRQFKKHKVLPRPQNDRGRDGKKHQLSIDTAASANHTSYQPESPQTLKHQLKRIGPGPDLPPTPPTQSRASSSGHSVTPSSPTNTENSVQLTLVEIDRPPATPPDQRSPPTPDVTPPHPISLAKALRPTARDRGASASTMAPDSRAESFKTAREEVTSSEDDSGRSAVWHALASSTSQATIVRMPAAADTRTVQQQASGVTPKHLNKAPGEDYKAGTRGEFGKFDGHWGSASDAEYSRDERLQRVVTSRKQQPRLNGHHQHVVKDNSVASQTNANATKAVRHMPHKEAVVVLHPHPTRSSDQRAAASDLNKAKHPTNVEAQRLSGTSIRSAPSVVEVFLVDGPPKRQRTLRHVRKQSTLRDPVDNHSSSTAHTVDLNKSPKLPKGGQSPQFNVDYRRESNVSTTTTTTSRSLSSGRARREIWKSGAIPVVIVPDRRSSRGGKPNREPSLRSTSSRRSRRSSVGSSPLDSPHKDATPVFERQSRRSRAFSESDHSERTIDFPPAIPARSSSLSAPTSCNVSRAGSMTANSVKAQIAPQQSSDPLPSPPPEIITTSPDMRDLETEETCDTPGFDRLDDGMSWKKYSSGNTPFSVASIETCGTAAELSEALAIHMYLHQNSSVLMVNHSGRPLEGSDATQREAANQKRLSEPPKILTTSPDEQVPITPDQQQFSLDVDSPLRNPRAPPEPPKHPPAINFIPATPSGMTPDHDKVIHQGNYFESLREKPPRRPSIVKRAFSRRRHSVDYTPTISKAPGFLTRTFSLSRNVRKDRDRANKDVEGSSMYPRDDDRPAEEDKLHPFWRPQWYGDDDDDDFEGDEDAHDESGHEDKVYRYPLVDNRPQALTRSLSERMKRTFAILPTQEYSADDVYGPRRRTIRRTPSGNLRVMRRKASAESMKHGKAGPVLDPKPRRGIWRGQSSMKRSRRPSLGSRLGEIQNIPHLLSERRREKRSQRLRQMISGPREVRDGVGEVIRWGNTRVQSGSPAARLI